MSVPALACATPARGAAADTRAHGWLHPLRGYPAGEVLAGRFTAWPSTALDAQVRPGNTGHVGARRRTAGMSTRSQLAEALANAMLAGPWNRNDLLDRCLAVTQLGGRWLRSLVRTVVRRFPSPPSNEREHLIEFIIKRKELTELRTLSRGEAQVMKWFAYHPAMGAARWPVKRLDTLLDVEQWLGLGTSDLEWLSDRKGLEQSATETRLQNYRHLWTGRRLIEAPKQQLMHAQRKVLREILDAIPPHDAAHGFRSGRSVLTHARLHAGCNVVVRLDLRAFFTHVCAPRAHAVFRSAGYPDEVAHTLTGLCTNRTPYGVAKQAPFELRRLLTHWHLPQGAPTSPALANLAAYSLDVRLSALARRFEANYSRYADDLVFSGDVLFRRESLVEAVAQIAASEGFSLNRQKTRFMTSARRQLVTGVVVNQGVSAPRAEVERLEATLYNCVKHGIDSQARGVPHFREHLQGRVAWVEQLSPARGAELRALLSQL